MTAIHPHCLIVERRPNYVTFIEYEADGRSAYRYSDMHMQYPHGGRRPGETEERYAERRQLEQRLDTIHYQLLMQKPESRQTRAS